MRRQGALRAIVAVGAATAMLAACSPASTGSGSSGEAGNAPTAASTDGQQPADSATASDAGSGSGGGDITLTVWSWRPEDTDGYQAIFDTYESEHPGVTIKYQPFHNTEYNTKLKTGLSAAGGPDIAMLRAYGELQPLVAAGRLVPLDGKVDLSTIPDQVLDGARGRKDGKVYGVPFAIQTLQVFYNKKIFADHDISVPKTWQQMIDAAKKLKSAGVTPFATTGKDIWMLPIDREIFGAARAGGQQFAKQVLSGKSDFTDPDYVASLQLMKDLQPYFPDDVLGVSYEDSKVLFSSGQAAMFPGGSFELAPFKQAAPDMDIGIFQVPPPPGSVIDHPVTPGWVDASFGVSQRSQHKQAALDLIKWMATKEFGQMYSDKMKQLNPVTGVHPTDPLLKQMLTNYQQNPSPYTMLIHFRYGEPHGDEVEGEGIQALFLGKKTATQVGQSVQQGVSKWFKPAG